MIKKKSFVLIYLVLVTILVSPVSAKPKYVTTIHPLKAILERIVGNRGTVKGILPPGASPHTFDISPSIMREAESATAIIYVGADLDEWIIKAGNNQKIELLKLIPVDSLQNIFSFNSSGTKKNVGTDPHFWTDPLLVKAIFPSLVKELCQLDPDGCNIYKKNAEIFSGELDSLTYRVNQKLKHIEHRSVLLSHPFFQYYLHRFKFRVEGIIEPLPSREPTPKELQRIIELGKKLTISIILNNVQHPDVAAELVSESTGIPLLIMDPIGGVEGRISYEDMIMYNTDLLVKVLR